MRHAFSSPLALLTLVTAMTMVGCSDKRPAPAADKAAINTDNYFVEGQTIKKFYPDGAGSSAEYSSFDEGENQRVDLDTDKEKQGFEFMVYARGKTVYLKAYEKNSATEQKLISVPNFICGIYSRKEAVDESVAGFDHSTQITQDRYIVDVVSNDDESCDVPLPIDPNKPSNQYHEIDFSYLKPLPAGEQGREILSWRETSSAFVEGTMLRNFQPKVATDPETGEKIRWGHIGYDVLNKTVQFFDHNSKLVWAAPIETNGTAPKFFQASDELLLVQSDQDIYVRNIPELFVLGQKQDREGGELPSNSSIAQYFKTADLSTLSADASNPVSVRGDGKDFAMKDGSYLHFYNASNNTGFGNTPIHEVGPEITAFEFALYPNSPVQILINTTDNTGVKTLSLLTNQGEQVPSGTLASAQDVQFEVSDNTLYVNTFKEDQDRAVAPSWQAHRIVSPLNVEGSKKTYNFSMFLFATDQRTTGTVKLMLQSSTYNEVNGALVDPKVGPFSSTQSSGLFEGNVFGVINGNVTTSNFSGHPNFVMNDIYGGFFTETEDTNQLFYFNLRDPEDSLKLMY